MLGAKGSPGTLLNAAYEADGKVEGRILFLLDEVARLGPMAVLEAARDAGRKYGLTLLLLYQSVGQLVEQWGREGTRAWYDGTSCTAWHLHAALQDPETACKNARELSQVCGEHGVVAASQGSTSGRWGAATSSSAGYSASRSEMRRPLIKPPAQARGAPPGHPCRRGLRHHPRRQAPALRSCPLLP